MEEAGAPAPFDPEWAGVAAAARRSISTDTVLLSVSPLTGGHAGLSYRLRFESGGRLWCAMLKRSPDGVRREGVADVGAQVPLLRALHAHAFPVPRVLWQCDDDPVFRAPYVVFEWVEGRESFPLDRRSAPTGPIADSIWYAAVDLLAQLRRVGVPEDLAAWRPLTPLASELAKWEPTLRKGTDPKWVGAGLEALARLRASMPRSPEAAVVHGDFQPSNLLYDGARVRAVIDWDLATLGDPLVDLGWLLMWSEAANWSDGWSSRCRPGADALRDRYVKACGLPEAPSRWYEALAAFRFGAITCLNVRLHRSGRRVDPVWDQFAEDLPGLFLRALAILEDVT